MSTAEQQQQHPLLNARRRRFVEEDANASMAEILNWGSVPPFTDPEAVGHGVKTRSQAAAAEQAAGTMVEKAATALLRQKQRERARAAAMEAPPRGAIASPWTSKTLQRPARRAGRKPPQPQAVVSKDLFPYPHTPGKKAVAAVVLQQEEQPAVQGVTRGLSNTAFARRYRVPVFGAGSPTWSESAAVEAAAIDGGKKAVQAMGPGTPATAKTPARKSTSSKGKESGMKAAPAAAAAAVVVARTPVAGAGKAGSRSRRGSVERGAAAAAAAVNPETLASVEAGFRSFVAAMERENGRASSYEQHRRRHTRSSSSSSAAAGGGGGSVVVLASTPAKPKGKEEEGGEFVVVEHADAPAADVAKTAAAVAAAATVANESIGEAFGEEDVGRSEEAAGTKEKGPAAVLTTVPRSSSRAARRRNKGKAYVCDEVR